MDCNENKHTVSTKVIDALYETVLKNLVGFCNPTAKQVSFKFTVFFINVLGKFHGYLSYPLVGAKGESVLSSWLMVPRTKRKPLY